MTVAWHSDARSLERQRIPREFTTKSRVVIISNDWQTLNKNVAALQDRGHLLLFQPTAAEVHARAGMWFDDEEIYRNRALARQNHATLVAVDTATLAASAACLLGRQCGH